MGFFYRLVGSDEAKYQELKLKSPANTQIYSKGDQYMIQKARLVIIVIVVLIATGCSFTHQVNIQQDLIAEEEDLPKISSTGPVTVVMKAQNPSGSVELCKAGGRTYFSDYKRISEFALSSAKDILGKNGIEVNDSAEKQLTITALEGKCNVSGLLLNFIMDMTVETGNGITKEYSGCQKMMHLPERDFALSAATLNAVLDMFADLEIQRYLKE